jgi:hypothetical protein
LARVLNPDAGRRVTTRPPARTGPPKSAGKPALTTPARIPVRPSPWATYAGHESETRASMVGAPGGPRGLPPGVSRAPGTWTYKPGIGLVSLWPGQKLSSSKPKTAAKPKPARGPRIPRPHTVGQTGTMVSPSAVHVDIGGTLTSEPLEMKLPQIPKTWLLAGGIALAAILIIPLLGRRR